MKIPHWKDIHTIVFDFDGIFTNNKVYIDQDGKEIVRCDRGDGLGLDLLKCFIIKMNWDVDYFILSKEANPVVQRRAEKLNIKCHNNVSTKLLFLKKYIHNRFSSERISGEGIIYLGNDLNDLEAMIFAGFSVAPSDSHPIILKTADLVLEKKGGDGFVRLFIENLICINQLENREVCDLL